MSATAEKNLTLAAAEMKLPLAAADCKAAAREKRTSAASVFFLQQVRRLNLQQIQQVLCQTFCFFGGNAIHSQRSRGRNCRFRKLGCRHLLQECNLC